MINPNQLKGHEGELLKTLRPLSGCVCRFDIEEWESWDVITQTGWDVVEEIPGGTICMYIACDYDEHNQTWIDLLVGQRVLRVFEVPYNRWMESLIPWPHGGFIQKT